MDSIFDGGSIFSEDRPARKTEGKPNVEEFETIDEVIKLTLSEISSVFGDDKKIKTRVQEQA